MNYHLAIDIGASSGRHILGHVEDGKIAAVRAEGADAYYVAIAAHYGDGFAEVFGFVSVHHDAEFGFQLPAVLADVQDYGVHAKVLRGFLAAETGAEAAVEEDEEGGRVVAQLFLGVAVLFHLFCLLQRLLQVSDIFGV